MSIYLYGLCAYILFIVSLNNWSVSFRIIAPDYTIMATDVYSTSHQLYIMKEIWKMSDNLRKQIYDIEMSIFRSVYVLVCRRFGLSTFWFVEVLVCRRFGMLTFWSVDVSVCGCFSLSKFWFVDVLVCQRFGLSTFWLLTFRLVDVLTIITFMETWSNGMF